MFGNKNDALDSNYVYTVASRTQIMLDPQKYIDMQLMGWEYVHPLDKYEIVTLKINKITYYNRMSSISSSNESQ
tara:strand:+ start:230 stop:451 length:222 start_codon:yes stop_codon:yes gene_type:complete